jgi:hypothetical protein
VKRPIATAIAIAIGLIVLLGYFIPLPILTSVRIELVQWAIILSGVAVLVGVINLFSVHLKKIREKEKGAVYSLFLIAALLLTFILGIILGPDHSTMQLMFESVVIPVEASLMAMLAMTLIYASIRLLRRRSDLMTVVFLITVLLVLLGTAPLPFGPLPIVGDLIRPFIAQVLAAAGARGILLGVALGTLTTGLRIVFGADRPYGGR